MVLETNTCQLKNLMSFSNQSSFGERGSQRNSKGLENAIDESALKAMAYRFDVEIIFRLKLNQSERRE